LVLSYNWSFLIFPELSNSGSPPAEPVVYPGLIKQSTTNFTIKEGTMKTLGKKLLILCLIGFLASGFVSCKKEGTAEKAGKQIDQAIDSAKKQVEEATK
jgi:hypothetical protein